MTGSDEDLGSRRPSAEDRDGHTGWILGGRTIEWSGDAMCGGDKERMFLG
jgi:hypothetical protein